MPARFRTLALLAALALAGCDLPSATTGPGGSIGGTAPERPTDVRARYEWILEGWTAQGQPVGRPGVTVSWKLPRDWRGEPFRVYAARAGGSFALIATVTSCDAGACRYLDLNVAQGRRYEYYVAAVDEGSGREVSSDVRDAVTVPGFTAPPTPAADTAVGLDGALFLRWQDGGSGSDFWKYRVYLVGIDGKSYLYQLGEADAPGFLDLRAKNGHRYSYRVAALDTLGHVSALSPAMSGIPRPDFSGELMYAQADSVERSGFRFVASDSLSPIVAGTSTSAQWRLEVVNGTWQLTPVGETEVVDAGRTTALTCGPGSDPGCKAVTRAHASGYTKKSVPVYPEVSYVFRVRAADGRVHHGVVRPTLLGSDQAGRRLMIFDWAYQLIPDEPRLHVSPS